MKKQINQKVWTGALLVIGVIATWFFWPQLGTVVLAALMAYLFYPLYIKLKGKKEKGEPFRARPPVAGLRRQQHVVFIARQEQMLWHVDHCDLRSAKAGADALGAFLTTWQSAKNQRPPTRCPLRSSEQLAQFLVHGRVHHVE